MAIGDRNSVNLQTRSRIALGLAVCAFFVLGLRLWYLQIVQGEFFRDRSENNRLRTVYLPPPRGVIRDRNGTVLVQNRPSFNVELVTEDSPHPKETARKVAEILGIDSGEVIARLSNQSSRRRFEPKILVKDADRDAVARIMARRWELPGVVINVTPAREYLYGTFAAHVLGYIREITGKQLESSSYAGYRFGDQVGQYGLEAKLERYLQGRRGMQLVVVNAMGTRIGESSFESETAGHEVTLAIDLAVQKGMEEALGGQRGGVVALDPRSGDILALSSHPAFDPNMFTGELDAATWRDLVTGPEKKLANRVVQGTFAPGSTFKIFMAAAALAEGVISPNDRITCPGFLMFGSRPFKCHKHAGHGPVNLFEAMVQSCDVYFYTIGQRLGIDRIHAYATKFGLGRTTELELVEEAKGIIPSTEWKRRYFKDPANQKWFPGETLSVAIGQGAVTVTPLQLARSVAALVNGGRVLKPRLVKTIRAPDGNVVEGDIPVVEDSKVDIDESILKRVRESLVGVVEDPRGTGHRAQLPKEWSISVGGKTGTAQVVSLHLTETQEHFKDNAWFVAYAPADAPEIVVAALIENAGHGGVAAAPVVRQVMEAYFKSTRPDLTVVDPDKKTTPGGEDAD